MKRLLFILISIFLAFNSCIKNNPDPSWIELTEWDLENNPNSTDIVGELRHNITDVQVFINNEFIGIFEVPCKIPVLISGEANIQLAPVILNNGISSTKKPYPFMERMEFNTILVQNETTTISLKTRYLSNLFFWIEDFENSTSSFTQDPGSAVLINQVSDPTINDAFSGNQVGRISLDEINNSWTGYTNNQAFVLPKGEEVYMEIDFYNTNRITTGLLGVGPNGNDENPNIQLNPQDESEVKWKKIYIDLREIVSNSQNAEYFELTLQSLLDDGDIEGVINLDNIKIIHF